MDGQTVHFHLNTISSSSKAIIKKKCQKGYLGSSGLMNFDKTIQGHLQKPEKKCA